MQTFCKGERLCNTTAIAALFSKGNSIFKHPVKLLWLPAEPEGSGGIKVLISVPKRNFKKATDRNRIRRLMKECYRKNKAIAIEGLNGQSCNVALVYAGKIIPEYNTLEPIIIYLLQRLIQEYEKTTD